MLGYISGAYDVLRQRDLEKIDRAIQKNLERGNKYFAVAVYDDELCENLGLGVPLKNVEDRIKILQYLYGVDFAFSISSIDESEISQKGKEAFKKHLAELETAKESKEDPEFDIAYAPGTYDLFHAGHLENLLEAAKRSKKLIVGVKADELVRSHKNKTPMIDEQERMEIIRHFTFVDDVYKYYTRDPHAAAKWIKDKYGKDVDAIFLGSDLYEDFKNIKDIKLVFTDRDPKLIQSRSTTAYRRKIKLSHTEPNTRYRKVTELKTLNMQEKGGQHEEKT